MYINIKDEMKKQHLNKNQLAKAADVSYTTITAIYNGVTTSINLDILEKLCISLRCTPNDILIFETTKQKPDLTNFMNPPM